MAAQGTGQREAAENMVDRGCRVLGEGAEICLKTEKLYTQF